MDIVEAVKGFYDKGFAVREIADELGVSSNKIYKLMRRKKIPRRSVVEANRLAYLRKPATFKPLIIENQKQEILKAIGVMLYWAEGTKLGGTVDFANSDERMIKIFLRFLREICCIDERKLRVYLYCFPQHDMDFLLNYWSDLTNVPKNRFLKPYVRMDARGKSGHKMKYGLVHLRYHDKKLMMLLLQWVSEYCMKLSMEGYPSGQRG